MAERRVLRVPRGTVKENIPLAKTSNCPEIQEIDGLKTPEVYIEAIAQTVTPDYKKDYSLASTTTAKLDVLAGVLGLK